MLLPTEPRLDSSQWAACPNLNLKTLAQIQTYREHGIRHWPSVVIIPSSELCIFRNFGRALAFGAIQEYGRDIGG
jgi:hypothetical protein